MARRGAGEFYVYRIFDGEQTLYVGKGSGNRLLRQCRRFKCEGEILQKCRGAEHAFKREKFWIAKLHPTQNKYLGGNGLAGSGKSLLQKSHWEPPEVKEMREVQRIGPRKYAARFLLNFRQVCPSRIPESWLPKLLEVANA